MGKHPSPAALPVSAQSLPGQVAIVTGAGSGIGQAAAKALAASGVRVAALARTADQIRQTCADIVAAGGIAIPIVADVSRRASLQSAYARVIKKWGRLDLLVANAGVNGVWAPIEELKDEEWQQIFQINLFGTFLSVKLAVPFMRKQGGGAIAIVSSVNGTRVFKNAGASAYASTKAGQLAFGRMMAVELAQHGIRVNTVCPGAIDTQIDDNTQRRHLAKARKGLPKGEVIPLTRNRPGTSEQVGQVIHFLCSPLASHVTGAEIFVDGAESLVGG